jgi:GTPase SAR1 family protein
MEHHDYMFKILLVGDSAVGKSSVVNKYVNNCFEGKFISTVGVDFAIHRMVSGGKACKLQIWYVQ